MLYLYLYSVTGLSLLVFYFSVISGVNGFFDFIFQVPIGAYETTPGYESAITSGLGFAIVSFPLWVYHWRRLMRESMDFTESMLTAHRFYLFTVVCCLILMIIVSGGSGLASLLRMLFGFGESRAGNLSGMSTSVTIFLVSGGFWVHHWWQFRGKFGGMPGLKASAPEAAAKAKAKTKTSKK
ncbi:MAG: hypothetical protein HYZ26_05005 [Chloroflexi bacterium]|nr:hypothetical protein [Chloroflexota bacterium]